MKPISTRAHGVLDYLTAGTLLALPRMMGWGPGATRLLTRYELGLVKKLPMKGHLALDGMSGALLCVAPFLLLDEDEGDATGPLVGLGLFEIVVPLLTQTTPRGLASSRQ